MQESTLSQAKKYIHLPHHTLPTAIEVSHLEKRFGKLHAVKDISFTIGKGEIFGLLGPNGAGKSTTINIISGYYPPSAGDCLIDGLSITKKAGAVKKMIGAVPQEIALYPDMSALENLLFFGEVYLMPRQERKPRALELLEFVGLSDRARSPIKTFSGGMKRRINLAASLMHKPGFLLMDEPTVGVDPQSREYIFDTIEKIRSWGTTILYTTQYMEEAERLCDRIAIMDEGNIIALGTLPELLALREQEQEIVRPRGLQELFIQLTGKTLRD